MENIYYEKGGNKIGPVALEELKVADINAETLIWYEGLSEWKKAGDIIQISELLKRVPPPLPDIKRELQVSVLGFAFLLIQILYPFFSDHEYWLKSSPVQIICGLLFAIFCRIVIASWVIECAKKQNRDTTIWGAFAFFLPSLALIIIGLTKRLKS